MTVTFVRRWLSVPFILRGLTTASTARLFLGFVSFHLLLAMARLFNRNFGGVLGMKKTMMAASLVGVKRVRMKTTDGIWFVIRPAVSGDFDAVSESWEPEVKAVFRPRKGDVVIDVGAHLGGYAVRCGKLVGKLGKVLALEPEPDNFALLAMNIRSNDNFGNTTALRVAAFDTNEVKVLHKDQGGGSNSLVGIPKRYLGDTDVLTNTLDSIVKESRLSRIDWLKIDVEGAEFHVLNGAKEVLRMARYLIIEIWLQNTNCVYQLLREAGYELKVLYVSDVDPFMYVFAVKH